MKSSFAFAIFLAGYVAAQSTTASSAAPIGTAGIPACVLTCSAQAASQAGCSSITDVSCVCTSSAFQTAATTCLQSSCTPQEVQQALQLQQTLCGASTGTASGSAPASTATAPTASGSSTISRASSAVSSASSVAHSASSVASSIAHSASSAASASPSASTGSNAAAAGVVFNYAVGGAWAAATLGGAVIAQLVL